MPTKSIKLTKPIQGHGRMFEAVTLREPTAREYLELGEPQSPVYRGQTVMMADNDATIAQYIERCIVEPNALLVVGQATLADIIKLREAVLGFFTEARALLKVDLARDPPLSDAISAAAATPSSSS